MFSNRMTSLVLGSILLCFSQPAFGAVLTTPPGKQALKTAAAGLHLPFIANQGQEKDPNIAFVADTFACRVAVTRDGGIVYSQSKSQNSDKPAMQITERLAGAQVKLEGKDRHPARISYYPGRDRSHWRSDVPSYGQVTVGHITPKIRVDLKAHGQGVEKFFYLQPGADPAKIRLTVSGADKLKVEANGQMVLTTSAGSMRLSQPVAYQEIDGERRLVKVRYLVSQNTYGFELDPYDTSRELVIDPLVKVFDVKHGGAKTNAFMDVVSDDAGNVYVAGFTNNQLAIYKLDKQLETVQAVTFFSKDGRYHVDIIRRMALDSHGNVFVTGTTYNDSFPVTPGCHDNRPGNFIDREGFVAKFSPDLATLMAATYLGGDYNEDLYDLAIDSRDRIYVVGYSEQSDSDTQRFPVTEGAYDVTSAPEYQKKAVITRLNNGLTTVEAATFLGGSEDDDRDEKADVACCLALTNQGDVWVAGHTNHSDFPVTAGNYDSSYNGGGDLFLARLNPDLTELKAATYIGGDKKEAPTDLLLENAGDLYLLGWTHSQNFPMVTGGYDTSHGGHEEDGFILKLDADAGSILAATFLGGTLDASPNGDDAPAAMALSADNSQLVVVGRTESLTFPTTPDAVSTLLDAAIAAIGEVYDIYAYDAWDRDTEGDINAGDGFVTLLTSDLSRIIYSSFIGTNGCDYFDGVYINDGDILIAGEAQAGRFPLAPSNENTPRGVLLRFAPADGGDDSHGETPAKSSGSGGGGCFIRRLSP